MDKHQEDEEVIHDTNTGVDDNDESEDKLMRKARSAFQTFCQGLRKLVQVMAYLFVLFSVWFTIRAALCSLVVVDDQSNVRGCAASLRYLLIGIWRQACAYCQSSLDRMNIFHQVGGIRSMAPNVAITITTPSWILALRQPATDFVKATVLIVSVYWARFWGVHTHRMELPHQEGDSTKDRLLVLTNALKEATMEQAEEFRTYLLVVSVSAFAFAIAFAPLLWMVHLQALNDLPTTRSSDLAPPDGEEGCVVAPPDLVEVSWMILALKKFWMLFMIHFITSAGVADTMFNAGPLMNWWTPGEQGFVWFMGISVSLTTVVYPLGTAFVWYWMGSVQ